MWKPDPKDPHNGKYYIRNGEWTITKAFNVPKPYGLWRGEKNHGHYATSDEAKREYERLTR